MDRRNYSEKLQDPKWQKKRLEVMNRDGFKCRFCGNDQDTLNVHHLKYVGNPWEVDNDYLITLCEKCHENESKNRGHAENFLLEQFRIKGFSAEALFQLSKRINSLDSLTNKNEAEQKLILALT